MRPAFALIAAITLALPAVAQAATWSTSQTLSNAHTFIDDPWVVVARDGGALATWRFSDIDGTAGDSSASRAPGAGTFGRSRRLTPGLERVAGVAAYGHRRVLLASTRLSTTTGFVRRLDVRFGRPEGSFGRRVAIRRFQRIADVALAVNARGDAALAWFEDRGTRTDRVYVALRRAGRAFGAPRRLATGRVRSVEAAVGLSGDVLVGWGMRDTVRARFKPRTRSSFLPGQTIRSQDAAGAQLDAVVNAGGRAVLVWSAQRASEGGERGPVFFQGAVKPAGAQRFRRAELLERMPTEAGLGRPIKAAVDETGNVVIAWSGSDGVSRRVKAAQADQSGRFTFPQDVSAPGADALLSDLAVAPFGPVIAVWDGGIEDEASVVRAAVAPTAVQPFGPPEDVSPTGQNARFGRAAFDPRTRIPTVVFVNATGEREHFHRFAQAATRSP
jgi:hypothetical protein